MKINYQKRWGKDGTCYTQTIKINKIVDYIQLYNKMIEKLEIGA